MTSEHSTVQAENREHFDLTMSAGVIVTTQVGVGVFSERGIVLVEDYSGKVGIIAGGARFMDGIVETPIQIALRELQEETGNDANKFFKPEFVGNIVQTDGLRAKIGFIYQTKDHSFNPYAKPLDPKISKIVPTNRAGVAHLLRNPALIRKPEFNIEALLYWLHQTTLYSFSFVGGESWKARERLTEEGFDRNPNILGIQTLF